MRNRISCVKSKDRQAARQTVVDKAVAFSKEFVSANIIIKYLPKQLFASLAMGLAIAWIGKNHSGSIKISVFQVIAGIIIYFLILILTHEKFTLNILNRIKMKLK